MNERNESSLQSKLNPEEAPPGYYAVEGTNFLCCVEGCDMEHMKDCVEFRLSMQTYVPCNQFDREDKCNVIFKLKEK